MDLDRGKMISNNICGWRITRIAIGITMIAIILMAGGGGAIPGEKWNRTFGEKGDGVDSSVLETKDGGYLLVYTSSYEAGNIDGWLIKIDKEGNVLWNKTFNGTGIKEVISAQQVSNGLRVPKNTENIDAYGMNNTQTIDWQMIGAMSGVAQSIALLITIIFMYYQYKKTVSIMSEELSEVRKEINIASHDDLYDKLLTLYYKYIEYAPDLKGIFRSNASLKVPEIRERYIIYASLDIIYLMYLQRDALDKGLEKTWKLWINKIFEEPKIFEIYETVKGEYDTEYIEYIEKEYNKNKNI